MKKARRNAKEIETIETIETIEAFETIKTIETIEAIEAPKPREFEARPCSLCQNYRPHGKNYSRVYCTRGKVRYCKCDWCGNTWAQQG